MSEDLSSTIRSAIQNSEKRLPTIAKKTGVAMSALTEFMDGADLHLSSASRIAAYLDLELKPSAKRKRGAIQAVAEELDCQERQNNETTN